MIRRLRLSKKDIALWEAAEAGDKESRKKLRKMMNLKFAKWEKLTVMDRLVGR